MSMSHGFQSIKIRGLSPAALHHIEKQASQMGVSRNEYLRNKIELLALGASDKPRDRSKELGEKALQLIQINSLLRDKMYAFFPELQAVHVSGEARNDGN
ncbi:hypothetical protein [Listeria booriae]|uniref:hypothetical protein n=1 Tax=Listeria booriae TaxID=1552123 RepID=UPI001E41300C|nr:hypothetical protein [Listeria booriae]MCD2208584.1 hypothetical protein [Listeria booriae]